MSWKVTVRHGPRVDRERCDSLDRALAEARARAAAVVSGGGLGTAKAFRDYEPGQRVQARIEIDGPGLLRGAAGGIDVMGDGSLIAYSGSIRKRPLAAGTLDEAIDQLREALA